MAWTVHKHLSTGTHGASSEKLHIRFNFVTKLVINKVYEDMLIIRKYRYWYKCTHLHLSYSELPKSHYELSYISETSRHDFYIECIRSTLNFGNY